MSIDTNDLLARVGTAFYNNDALTRGDLDTLYNDVDAMIAEIKGLRERLEIRTQHGHNLRTMLESATDTERAAVVAWLREEAASDKETAKQYHHAEGLAYWRGVIEVLEDAADCIDRGEHRREEER